jgi:Uma2 family endonuclease
MFQIDEAFLSATLTVPPMTDQQFSDFCAEHPDLFFEASAEGDIIVMSPNFTKTGARNLKITMQLGNWAEKDGRGIAGDPRPVSCFRTARGARPMHPGHRRRRSASSPTRASKAIGICVPRS